MSTTFLMHHKPRNPDELHLFMMAHYVDRHDITNAPSEHLDRIREFCYRNNLELKQGKRLRDGKTWVLQYHFEADDDDTAELKLTFADQLQFNPDTNIAIFTTG